jgi:hypothetical protein
VVHAQSEDSTLMQMARTFRGKPRGMNHKCIPINLQMVRGKHEMKNHTEILSEFYEILSAEDKILYKALANKAIELGYVLSRDKTKSLSFSFRNNKTKFTIMKFAEIRKDEYGWKFKFSANKSYSKIFDESIKSQMEECDFKFAKCFGCRKYVNPKKLNYNIEYNDGRKYWICGLVFFIEIKTLTKEIVEEAGKMMRVQHEACYNIHIGGYDEF